MGGRKFRSVRHLFVRLGLGKTSTALVFLALNFINKPVLEVARADVASQCRKKEPASKKEKRRVSQSLCYTVVQSRKEEKKGCCRKKFRREAKVKKKTIIILL